MVKGVEKKNLSVQKVATHIFLIKEIECKCEEDKTKGWVKFYCAQNGIPLRDAMNRLKQIQKVPPLQQ